MSDPRKPFKAMDMPQRPSLALVADGIRAPKTTTADSFLDIFNLARPYRQTSAFAEPGSRAMTNDTLNVAPRGMPYRMQQSSGASRAGATEYATLPYLATKESYPATRQTGFQRFMTKDYVTAFTASTTAPTTGASTSLVDVFTDIVPQQQQAVPYSVYPHESTTPVQRLEAADFGTSWLRAGKRTGHGNMAAGMRRGNMAAAAKGIKITHDWEIDDALKAKWRAHLQAEKQRKEKK